LVRGSTGGRRPGFWFFVSLAIVCFSVPIALVTGFAVAAAVDTKPVAFEFPSTISIGTIEKVPTSGTQTFVLNGNDGHPAVWAALVLVPLALGVVAVVQIASRR
jgi:hypothetical protein